MVHINPHPPFLIERSTSETDLDVKFSNFIDIWLPADELLLKLDVNPTEKLINIAESDDASIGQRIRCWQEIAKYTHSKLKSQEIYIEPVEPIEIHFVSPDGAREVLT